MSHTNSNNDMTSNDNNTNNNTTITNIGIAVFIPLNQEPPPLLLATLKKLLDNYKQPNAPSDALRELLPAATALVLKHPALHWWCHEGLRPVAKELLHLFSLAEHGSIHRYKDIMDNAIGGCIDCAEAYYADRRVYLYDLLAQEIHTDVVESFFQALLTWDCKRLCKRLELLAQAELSVEIQIRRKICVCEIFLDPSPIMQEPYLSQIMTPFSTLLGIMLSKKRMKLGAVLSGTWLLSVHEDPQIQTWAILANSKGAAEGGLLMQDKWDSWEPFKPIWELITDLTNGTRPPIGFPFSNDPNRILRAIRSIVSSMHPTILTMATGNHQWAQFQNRLLSWVLDRSGQKLPVVESCKLLFSMLKIQECRFWTANASNRLGSLEDAMSLLKTVFTHPQILDHIKATAIKERQEPTEAQPHPEGVHEYITWISVFVRSLSGMFEQTVIDESTPGVILELVSDRMRARADGTLPSTIDKETLDGLLEFDLTVLSTFRPFSEPGSVTNLGRTLKSHWLWLAKLCAIGSDSFSLLGLPDYIATRITKLSSKITESGRRIALKLLRQEVETIWQNYGAAIVAIKSKSAAILEETNTEMWLRIAQSTSVLRDQEVLNVLGEASRHRLVEWQTDVVDVFSALALLPRLETRSTYNYDVLAMCSAFNDTMDVMFSSSSVLLQGIAAQGEEWLKGLVNSRNKRVITKLLRFWSSPDADTRAQALYIMQSAWKEVTRQSCLRLAFEIGGEQSIEEIIGILADFRDRGCPGGATPPVLFQLLLDSVTILFLNNTTDGEGGLYLHIFLDLTSSQEVARHLTLVKELWNSIWQSLNAAFEAGATTWHTQQARSETINTMKTLADVGLLIIGKIRYLERLLEFEKQDLDSGAQDQDMDIDIFSQMSLSQPVVVKETMPLEYLEAGMPRLAPWMYAQDLSLCSAALDLACAILNLLADKGHSIKYTNNERLVKIAAGDKDVKLLLSEEQCARLEDSLGRHPDYFDEETGYHPHVAVAVTSSVSPTKIRDESVQSSTHSKAETIEISDDDFGDIDDADLNDLDFDDVDTEVKIVAAPRTSFSSLSDATDSYHFQEAASQMKPALRPDFMRKLTGSTYQTKLNFTAGPAPPSNVASSTTGASARRLPPTLTRFNLNLSSSKKPAPKPASSKKGTSKLGMMREDHRRERGNLVAATRQARAESKYKKAVSKLPDKIVTSVRSGSVSESESEAELDDDDNGFGSLVESDLSMNNKKEVKTEPRKTKLLELTEVMGPKLVDSVALKRQIKMDEARRMQRLMPNLAGLHAQILQWEVSATGDRPPNGKQYAPIPSTFDSVESYVKTFEPLLVLECWEGFLSSKEEANQSSDTVTAMVVNRVSIDNFQDIHMMMPKESAGSLNVEDIVVVSDTQIKDALTAIGNAARRKPFLAKVQSITRVKGVECEVVMRACLKIEESSTLMSVTPQSKWNILKLMNLTPIHREYAALIAMRYFELCETILKPTNQIPQKPSQNTVQQIMDTYKVNTPQAQAIVGAIEKPHGFTLIQGPPGTGKTKTILGLVGALLADGSRTRSAPAVLSSKSTDRPLRTGTESRILVCAPSNAAIDEIVKRLKGGIRNNSGMTFIPKVVRVGNLDSVNAEAKDVVLETLIAKELESASTSKDDFKATAQSIAALLDKMKQIGNDIEKARLELVTAKDEGSPTLISEAEAKIRALRHSKWKVGQDLNVARSDQAENTQKRDQARKDARDKILGEADVICSTLSASGHDLLTNNIFSFETVIIDEAAQSVEVSSLIPLKYGCKRCILVGDPNQLPPTVKSQLASKYSYNQSLFVRIQDLAPASVHLLSIQYRMHPDISAFPSREFYKSLLKDGPDMAGKTFAEWHRNPIWSPYRFFDVHEGREKIGLSHSQHNPIEAEAAVELLEKLCNSNPSLNFFRRVGVISPYQQQVRTLKEYFSRRFGSKIIESVDFNSVDGFQGQEKDIIIFSCVRASTHGTVGFLADVRRMNVALTRARQSLFILGHADTLRRETIWGDLVQDAESRGLFTKVYPDVFGPRSLSAMPLNLLEPRTAGDRRNDLRNDLYGKVSEHRTATVIDRPLAVMDQDMDEGFSYPSLPESSVVSLTNETRNERFQGNKENGSLRGDPRIRTGPGYGHNSALQHKRKPEERPSDSGRYQGYKRKPEERRPDPESTHEYRKPEERRADAGPASGYKRPMERPRSDPEPVARSREQSPNPVAGSSESLESPAERKIMAHALPTRPPSPKRAKKAPSLFLKSSSSGVNSIPLRERLAAGVLPIRKSYPSSAANSVPVAPRRSAPAPSLDDLLNTMKK
ncbi:DEAD-box type RNA helicase [Podila minutissima]|uniref:DEAD-box type RNA helicase n=1 Tax=Podila minutissima TaxID=64525 RepID=A0A9P5VJ98_9FUNG|nr:DEAD-box type RNA helicase [Podila minutissima]